jgi:hypothetical protein
VVPQSPDDDKLLSDLWRAAAFMQAVRVMQAESGRTLAGQSLLSLEQEEAIIETARNSALVGAVKEQAQVDGAVNHLAMRFEEMCRRQRMEISKELRPAMLKLLATELWVNHKALRLPAEKVTPVTVYQGAIGPELEKGFERFRDKPWIFTTAAVSHASNPRGFLTKVAESVDEMASEPEFERFRDTPGIFATAAAHNPSNPRAYVREKIQTIDAILKEPEFEHLRDTPSIITVAVCSSSSDPRDYLRERKNGGWRSRVSEKPEERATLPRQV